MFFCFFVLWFLLLLLGVAVEQKCRPISHYIASYQGGLASLASGWLKGMVDSTGSTRQFEGVPSEGQGKGSTQTLTAPSLNRSASMQEAWLRLVLLVFTSAVDCCTVRSSVSLTLNFNRAGSSRDKQASWWVGTCKCSGQTRLKDEPTSCVWQQPFCTTGWRLYCGVIQMNTGFPSSTGCLLHGPAGFNANICVWVTSARE